MSDWANDIGKILVAFQKLLELPDKVQVLATTIAARGSLLIFDALAIRKSWTRPCTTIYEIKVSRGDFLSDEKWPAYRPYCNKFYFACPTGLISPDELSNGVGLIYWNAETGALRTVRAATMGEVEPVMTKLVFQYVIMNRLDDERHPFFSTARDYFEAMVEDRDERRDLGAKVRSKILDENRRLGNELDDMKRKSNNYKVSNDRLKELLDFLRSRGLSTYNNETLIRNLEMAMDGGRLNQVAQIAIGTMEKALGQLRACVKER